MRDQPGSNLQSVRRALRALELISESGECGVTELGRKLGVHKATASRLVATLAERGFVERDPITEKYRLGFGLIALAGAAVGANDLVRSARPILEDLAERTRETVNVGVLSGDAVVYVDQVAGTRSIVSVNWVGQRTPLHCTSNGKVLLAFMREDARDRLLAEPLPRLTPRTITDPERLRRPAHRDPCPRLRTDDGRTRRGPQRRGRADPWDERGPDRRAQRFGAGVPDARRRPAEDRPGRRRGGRGGLAPLGSCGSRASRRGMRRRRIAR